MTGVVATVDYQIRVSEAEMAELIRRAAGRPVDFAFGPGWAALEWRAGEPMPWAVGLLGMMRGVFNENCEGAGI